VELEKDEPFNQMQLNIPPRFWENPEFIRAIRHEVRNQLQPFTLQMEKISKQLASAEYWRNALWGDETGTKGYLEVAREEDTKRYNQLVSLIEGKNTLSERKSLRKVTSLTRLVYLLGILAAAGILDFLKPVLQHWLKGGQ
jgi:hypothetical protein